MTASPRTNRVGLVARGAHVAGGERSLLELARCLPARYRPVLVLTERGELESIAREEGLEVVRSDWTAFDRRRPWAFAASVREKLRLFDEHDLDLVHVNSPVEASSFVAAARLSGRPSVVHVRIAYPRRFLFTQGLALADSVIFNSEALRAGVGWSRADVVHNGVRLPPIPDDRARRDARRRWDGGDGVWLGQVGQVIPMKGVDLSVRAFARCVEAGADAHLLVVGEDQRGEGAHRREMEALVAAMGVADRVRFVGYQRHAEEWMAGLDLLVCPSREEPFGRVLIEAMAREVPVIAARVGGIPEVVRDGIDGLLVPADDVDALTAAMREAIASADLRRRWGREGRRRAEECFDSEVHARRVASIYDRVGARRVAEGSGALR